MRYLICYTRPEPVLGGVRANATFVPEVEVANLATDEQAIDRATALMLEKRYKYFVPKIDAVIRDDPRNPQNIFTADIARDLKARAFIREQCSA